MTLGAWLMLLVGPLAKQALTALGIGIVAYVGVEAAVSAALTAARNSWGGMSGDALAYMAMAGFNTALGIVAAGVTARVTMLVLKRMVPK